MSLLSLAEKQASWLGARQQIIAANVANSDTPGFRAADIAPFEASLERAGFAMAATAPGHMTPGADAAAEGAAKISDGWDISYSGNSVSLEQQMLKAGEVHRAFALNASIVKAFNGMILSGLKG